ncbi:Putative SARP family pathway specific regulatory protein [Streptomyces venezuelae]|uniref:AfsR/SARP family transcriptional regulator n=1 Tax=Streptomyces gardneri TaxID=66892 RepID=UPI0006BD1E69|nr:AfsR/SARP family transcriptional regulator [Streptomyces gardneri]ALO08529.1 Putative SARP family pathway specific regulatory protein [Streptomyces venezuelae]QPK45734.1 AfsR/SARP family transcriptional regulator [Streptomyces gardneri]WRK37080.1 AfsR/SARP family transcriptional regulator [Streptomyces venezuelae]CUM41105.1 regulatory protein [Streptomyces venezuelae]
MDVRILGGLSVRENGVSITPTAAAPRQLLALLTASADQVVPVTVLTEELWPSGAPRGARAELQSHIAELRRLIAAALICEDNPADNRPGWSDRRTADAVLVSQPGGYRLDTGGGVHDVWQFERAAGAGYRAMEAGDLTRAALRLGEALALWRGEPYAGVAAGPRLRREIERLEASRLSVLDQWIEAQLGLGRHAELVSELSGLVARYRTNEALHAHYLVALLRCGHHDEALTAYERLRAALAGESGTEPSARLRRLHRSVLTVRNTAGRSVFDTHAPAWAATRTAAHAPAYIPAHIPAQYSPVRPRPVPVGSLV